jgi:hypothetical protein
MEYLVMNHLKTKTKTKSIASTCAVVALTFPSILFCHVISAQTLKKNTQEEILLKGVRFGVPNAGGKLMEICLTTLKEMTDDIEYAKRQGSWCVREPAIAPEKGYSVLRMAIAFGNIVPARPYPFVAYINDQDDSLDKVITRGSKSEMLELAALLSAKYGQPFKTQTSVENNIGNQFLRDTFLWRDSRGTKITIISIDESIDVGKLIIESPEASVAAETEQRRQTKEKLNNL